MKKARSKAGHTQEKSCLQVLLRPLVDAIKRGLQVLHRVRHTEAQIALTKSSERRARQTSNSGFVEQSVSQFLRRPSRLRDVGEGVERAFWQATRESLD